MINVETFINGEITQLHRFLGDEKFDVGTLVVYSYKFRYKVGIIINVLYAENCNVWPDSVTVFWAPVQTKNFSCQSLV